MCILEDDPCIPKLLAQSRAIGFCYARVVVTWQCFAGAKNAVG